MNVPLLDLQPQMKRFRTEILQAVSDVIDSTQYILGPEVERLEQKVAQYCATTYGIGVSSGTDALLASLMALQIGPGDAVLTTPYSFFATVGTILRVGAEPVFADIEPGSMNIDPEEMAAILADDRRGRCRIKALLPVHLFGQCADMQKIMALAEKYDLPVIEDAAQAIGAEYPFVDGTTTTWKRAGGMGLAGCFSFFPSKNLGGIGDGGMVTTSDHDFSEVVRSCRNHGAEPKYYHGRLGGNFRLDPVQATVLSIKLPYLDEWNQARRNNSALYRQFFTESGLLDDPVILPEAIYQCMKNSKDHEFHIYNQYVIRVPRRDALRKYLQEQSIGTEIYYPLCLHQQECLLNYSHNDISYPVAEQAAAESLALPIFPELAQEQIRFVVDSIADFYQAG